MCSVISEFSSLIRAHSLGVLVLFTNLHYHNMFTFVLLLCALRPNQCQRSISVKLLAFQLNTWPAASMPSVCLQLLVEMFGLRQKFSDVDSLLEM